MHQSSNLNGAWSPGNQFPANVECLAARMTNLLNKNMIGALVNILIEDKDIYVLNRGLCKAGDML